MPIRRVPRDQVDAFLEACTGITTADLTAPWAEKAFIYLEEYDAYYNFTSDFGPGWFECGEGVRDGDIVRLTGYGRELTLEAQVDETYVYFLIFAVKAAVAGDKNDVMLGFGTAMSLLVIVGAVCCRFNREK